MRKILIVSMALFFSVAILTNCKKKYKCECVNYTPTYDENGNVVDSTQITIDNSYLRKLSKSKANEKKGLCEASPGCTFERDTKKNKNK